eukprot:304863-Ditylum_brightwellii.AAC.1
MSLNHKDKQYVYIPKADSIKSALTVLKRTGFVDEVVKAFGGKEEAPEDVNVGVEFLCSYFAKHYRKEFKSAASKQKVTYLERQEPYETAAMVDKAKLTKSTLQIIATHLKSWAGKSVLAPEKILTTLWMLH